MLGYSDSNKDAGILASSFALYRAQQGIVELERRHGVAVKVFHGRGGSIGRGGGPSQRAIESLPPGSIDGRFKLTEQGEVLGWKYLLPPIAERNLALTVGGVLGASLPSAPAADISEYEAAFARAAATSLDAYRALIHHPRFVEYFQQSSPLDEIGALPLGSRPARRSGGASLEDLRAIPWVFAWNQSRQMVPGWFGAGRALTELVRERGAPFVRRMRDEWPFFATTLDAVAVALAAADMAIAAEYASLVLDRALGRSLFRVIALDHGRAERAVRAIAGRPTLLAAGATLARSIELRNPYVDPLSFIQIELLRRKRAIARGGGRRPGRLAPRDPAHDQRGRGGATEHGVAAFDSARLPVSFGRARLSVQRVATDPQERRRLLLVPPRGAKSRLDGARFEPVQSVPAAERASRRRAAAAGAPWTVSGRSPASMRLPSPTTSARSICVPELAHVARPRIPADRLDSRGREAVHAPAGRRHQIGEHLLREQDQIRASLAEGRDAQLHDRDAVEEIAPEGPFLDHRREVAVGRDDHARRDPHRPIRPEPLERALLEHAQELGLAHERKLPDLVEQDRPLTSGLERAGAGRGRAGERAALVPEQLALDQRLGDRRAVDDAKRLLGPGAPLVEQAREERLPYPRLAFEEDHRVRRGQARNEPRHLESGGRVPEERTGAADGSTPQGLVLLDGLLRRAEGHSGQGHRDETSGDRREAPHRVRGPRGARIADEREPGGLRGVNRSRQQGLRHIGSDRRARSPAADSERSVDSRMRDRGRRRLGELHLREADR